MPLSLRGSKFRLLPERAGTFRRAVHGPRWERGSAIYIFSSDPLSRSPVFPSNGKRRPAFFLCRYAEASSACSRNVRARSGGPSMARVGSVVRRFTFFQATRFPGRRFFRLTEKGVLPFSSVAARKQVPLAPGTCVRVPAVYDSGDLFRGSSVFRIRPKDLIGLFNVPCPGLILTPLRDRTSPRRLIGSIPKMKRPFTRGLRAPAWSRPARGSPKIQEYQTVGTGGNFALGPERLSGPAGGRFF